VAAVFGVFWADGRDDAGSGRGGGGVWGVLEGVGWGAGLA